MNDKARYRIFIDSNVLIAALFVHFSACKTIITLASYRKINLLTCQQVIEDIEAALRKRCRGDGNSFNELMTNWQKMKSLTRLQVLSDPVPDKVLAVKNDYLSLMRHATDIPILASALAITPLPDFILSGNREHFNDLVSEKAGIPIYSCSEFIDSLEVIACL